MSEIDASPENSKIPENWNFPERDETDLKLVQIDSDARFLAFTLPDGRGHKSVEYFFDTEGDIRAYCHVPFLASINVGLTSDCKAQYGIMRTASVEDSKLTDIFVMFKKAESELDTDLIEDRLGVVFYYEGKLFSIYVDSFFLEPSEEKDGIDSPRYGLHIENGGIEFSVTHPKEYVVDRKEYISGDFVLREKSEQKVDVFDNNKKHVFEINWEIQGADREEHREESLVVSQKHTPTGIIKTLRAPLRIDLQKVAESINVRPPYNKEKVGGKEHLVVPWRNIDRIVGASISYSYPPPTPQK